MSRQIVTRRDVESQPYAYSIADYDAHEVFPTLAAAVASLKDVNTEPGYLWDHDLVQAHYHSKAADYVSVRDWIEKVEVDRAEVETYIDHEIASSRTTWAELTRGSGCFPHTGSPPLFMLDREDLIQREIELRSYTWKVVTSPLSLWESLSIWWANHGIDLSFLS